MVELRPRPGAFAVTPRKLDSRSLINRELEGRDFRDQLIAASLKPILQDSNFIPAVTFPRSIDRGLIEAKLIADTYPED